MRTLWLRLFEKFIRATAPRRQRGQSLIIVAGAFIGLAVMVGLAVDGGILFITQAHLRRAVDAAAVAAATQMRVGQTPDKIEDFAKQFIKMNGIDTATVTVSTWNYNNGEEPARSLAPAYTCRNKNPAEPTHNFDIYNLCARPLRKYIRVEGQSVAQFSFMQLMGIYTTTVVANATSEAASVDAVLVFDTSMSMGSDTTNGGDRGMSITCNDVRLTDPLNEADNCRPLWKAKYAAKRFVDQLYPNYDRVALVNFDFRAHISTITNTVNGTPVGVTGFSEYLGGEGGEHDDTAAGLADATGLYKAIDEMSLWIEPDINLLDGDISVGQYNPLDSRCFVSLVGGVWTSSAGCTGSGSIGNPGENPAANAFVSTCTGCGIRVAGNLLKTNGRPSALWIIIFLSDGGVNVSDVPMLTSDPDYNNGILRPDIKQSFYNGYCGIVPSAPLTPTESNIENRRLWAWPSCVNGGFYTETVVVSPTYQVLSATLPYYPNVLDRHCGPYHSDPTAGGPTTCPPGAQWVGNATAPYDTGVMSPPYDAADYARDMIDKAALTVTCPDPNDPVGSKCEANQPGQPGQLTDPYNYKEPANGANVTIYTIGLGKSVVTYPHYAGEELLRYMAAVGDDGNRVTNPCPTPVKGVVDPAKHGFSCGNYYYAPSGDALRAIFEDIAKKIFTRLTK